MLLGARPCRSTFSQQHPYRPSQQQLLDWKCWETSGSLGQVLSFPDLEQLSGQIEEWLRMAGF